MVDVYGSKRGAQGPPREPGPPGKKGKDAFELCKWCPISMLRMFRENEACNFYFDAADDGILEGGKGLKDRTGKRNAMCLQNFEKPIKVDNIYALPLRGAVYKVKDITLALAPTTIAVVALSFQVLSEANKGYIFSNTSNTRGVSVTKKTINILGTSLELEHHDGWNTLIIQYPCINEKEMKCSYVFNGDKGTFTQKREKTDHTLLIGEKGKKANVLLGSLELYCKTYCDGEKFK